MEEFDHQMSDDTNSRGVTVVGGGGDGFLYGSPVLAPASGFHLQSGNCFDQSDNHQYPIVKTEAGTSQNQGLIFHHLSAIRGNQPAPEHRRRPESDTVDAIKAKIVAHPQYSNLLEAYMNCQKVGAPPEVVARLTSVRQEFEARRRSTSGTGNTSKDPELDQFMEAYFDMLVKYQEELSRPLQEAMEFMRRVETQLNVLAEGPAVGITTAADEKLECGNSSEEDQDNIGSGDTGLAGMDPRAEDRELKSRLLKKYSGCLNSLKQEISKKKKKGKLPKDARQKLLSWWELHYKWPYPSESEKLALAESTGLDQKQINNWFINQRKRHWKPSEDMHFMVMDQEFHHPHMMNPAAAAAAAYYMDGQCMGAAGRYRLGP